MVLVLEIDPIKVLPVEKLLGRLLRISEIRKDVPTKFRSKCDLYVIDLVDDKPLTDYRVSTKAGFFNGHIGKEQYLQAGDKIRIAKGKTITGSLCYVLSELNGKKLI